MNRAGISRTLAITALAACSLLAACGGDDAPTKATPTPDSVTGAGNSTATAAPPTVTATIPTTPPPLPCPYEPDACALAIRLGETLVAKNWTAAGPLFSGTTLTCPEPPKGPPAGLGAIEEAVCVGKAKGEKVRAVPNGFLQTDAITATLLLDVPAMLEKAMGTIVVPPLYSIGSEGPATCFQCRVVVLASAESNRAVVIRIVNEGGKWGAVSIYRGGFSSVDRSSIMGRTYHLFQGSGQAWVPEVTANNVGTEYEAVVSAKGDCLNVRQGPTLQDPVIRCLPDGTEIYVREPVKAVESGGITWVNVVRYDGDLRISGFASKEFVKKK